MSLFPFPKEFHHEEVSPYSPNFPLLSLKLNFRACYECQASYLTVLCHFVADLSVGTQKPHSKSIENHSLASLNDLVRQVVCIQTVNNIGKISCYCLGGKKKNQRKRRRYFSSFKENTFFSSFFFLFLSVSDYYLAYQPFLLPCPCFHVLHQQN